MAMHQVRARRQRGGEGPATHPDGSSHSRVVKMTVKSHSEPPALNLNFQPHV